MSPGVKWSAIFSSLLGIGLGFQFLFSGGQELSSSTKMIVVLMLIVPSAIMALSIGFGLRFIMAISLIWLAPYSLYFAIVSIPSIWNVFFLILVIQIIATVSLFRHKKNEAPPG